MVNKKWLKYKYKIKKYNKTEEEEEIFQQNIDLYSINHKAAKQKFPPWLFSKQYGDEKEEEE